MGESFRSLVFQYRISHSWISVIVKEVAETIVKAMLASVIPSPTSEQLANNETKYASKCNFPNCIGAIDEKHVRIKAPSNSGSLYYTYKEYYSIVLLALVNAVCKLLLMLGLMDVKETLVYT